MAALRADGWKGGPLTSASRIVQAFVDELEPEAFAALEQLGHGCFHSESDGSLTGVSAMFGASHIV